MNIKLINLSYFKLFLVRLFSFTASHLLMKRKASDMFLPRLYILLTDIFNFFEILIAYSKCNIYKLSIAV